MSSNKIPDITLIANSKKKKRSKINLNEEKTNLFTIIENIIDYEFPQNNQNLNKDKNISYIENNLLDFIKIYINLNRNLKNINILNLNKNNIIKSIINDLLNDIVFRCEINNINIDNIDNIDNINNIDNIDNINNINIVKKNKEVINSINLI